MTLWLDAQISPGLASRIEKLVGERVIPVRELGLRDASDLEIFQAAREVGAVVLTKDQDFVELVLRLGAPPPIILLTCGNSSNSFLMGLFEEKLAGILEQIRSGERLVELE